MNALFIFAGIPQLETTAGGIALAFAGGVATSIGPCVAPRFLAVAAVTAGARRPLPPTIAFVGGLLTACLVLGYCAAALASLARACTPLYAALACALLVAGGVTLVRAGTDECSEPRLAARDAAVRSRAAARRDAPCHHDAAHARRAERPVSLGGIFLLGAASALVVSPCCTPVFAAIAASAFAFGNPLHATLLLLGFGCGHALPLIVAATLASNVRRRARRAVPRQATAIVSGALLLGLGAYYGLLA